MKRLSFVLAAAGALAASPAGAQEAAGDWSGTLEVNETAKLPLEVHIQRDESGSLNGTLDSPAQGARGMPLAEIEAADGKLAFEVPVVRGSYAATWDAASEEWRGTWRQGGLSLPLTLSAGVAEQAPPPLLADWQLPGDDAIAALIADRIAPRAGEGIVVGVASPDGDRFAAAGPAGGEPFDRDTVFEIGSISKVFTALILADMANKGEVSLDDPAAKYLPAGHTMPTRGGKEITLRDLSQHRSGLPRLPDNMAFGDPEDPYADYTVDEMLAFLDGYELTRDVGSQWEYSNFGVGLLGYLLGRAAGTDYATLLRQRVTGPLGMDDTAVTLSAGQQARFAPGHDAFMRPAKPWHLPALTGAGGIRSTAGDMLKFAEAGLDPGSPLGPAMKTALAARAPGPNDNTGQALGWLILRLGTGGEVLMHDGGTGGYRSTLALDPSAGHAVVVLANSAAEPSTNDIGLHVLVGLPVAPTPPVPAPPPPPKQHTEITLPSAELDRVAGRYDFGDGVVFEVTRDGERLKAQRVGAVTGPAMQIFPAAPLLFFWKGVDAEVRFTTDESGAVTGAEFTEGGETATGERVAP